MKSGAEFEVWIKELVRAECAKLLGLDVADLPEDDDELRQLAQDRAEKLRARRRS